MATATEGIALSDTDRAAATEELHKFFSLINGEEPSRFKMFSPAVDAVWHDLLHRPDEYRAFLENAGASAGLGHAPASGFGVISWVEKYHAIYGQLPEIWFKDAEGNLNDGIYSTYLETSTVVTAWDCTPVEDTFG